METTLTATLTTLADLGGSNGATPFGGLVFDANGDLFGTTEAGGAAGDGTVFEIANTASGYGSATTLVSFTGSNGSTPYAKLYADSNGNLFGTTTTGGTNGNGTVFEVANTASGYASTPTTLVNLTSANGTTPIGKLIADSSGDLFGTTSTGGPGGGGTVFEIAKTASGYASTATTLVNFNGTNGSTLFSGLTSDASGDLFGVTFKGGANNKGTVFEIAKTASGYASSATTLATFDGTNGAYPYSGLTADASGNLFGTTLGAGGAPATVFEIAKTASGYSSSITTLASITGSIYAGVIIDGKGDVFGTTYNGGANSKGSVFEIAKNGGVYASTATTIYSFSGPDGSNIKSGLTADAAGDLFGVATNGGANNAGTVFELTNTGYTPACYCPGTLILTSRGEIPVEDLAIGDVLVTASGEEEAVRWIGRRSYAGRFLARQPHLLPVVFRAGSLGEGLPRRDLRVSPAHAMFIDGVLVPASCLVNGTTIVQDRGVEQVDYIHVELAQHGVILAEGAASETFLDDGSRGVFRNAAEYDALYPDAAEPAGFCARRVDSGFELDAIRRRLADAEGTGAIAA